jgi:hypothetical protein
MRQNRRMNWRNFFLPLGLAALLYLSFRAFGWWGFSLACSGTLFWLLQHVTRLMKTMEAAAQRPMGTLDNAVMFHSQLHAGQRLLEVIGLARSLGQRQSAPGEQPETFVWHDEALDRVECSFDQGRLVAYQLIRAAADLAAQLET